jgi:DNA-binding FadR family transcriptional regulator
VETGIAELTAIRASEFAVRNLREMVGEMSELVDDFAAFRACDVKFHIAIAQITGNTELVRMAVDVQGSLGELLRLLPPSKEALLHSNQQHADVVSAISRGDADAARMAMKAHVSGTEHFLSGLLPS